MSEKKSFKDTLNLPTTDFSIRANANEKEPELLRYWQEESLYKKTFEKDPNKKDYILHDGPPYANGHIHMGTAFNKVIKDIVGKSRRMMGYNVPITPGYDCHGLPIEIKVSSELGWEKDKSKIDSTKLKAECRKFAEGWIKIQTEEFKNLGILNDWDNPYKTMDPKYEASILRAFAKFVEGGFVERKGKTVPWCASCQTVLATAEIEYQDRKDPSIYINFPLSKDQASKLFPDVKQDIGFLVWTTTPWTIPLNRAVVLNPSANYVLLEGKDNKAFIVGEALADDICKTLEVDKKVLKTLRSKDFDGVKVNHPFVEGLQVPILFNDIVTLGDGTACMHMAPGCGPEDYLIAVKNNVEIFSPLTPDGKYAQDIKPEELEGMPVTDGQIWVIRTLAANGNLIYKTSLRHSYPHCWRCRNGLMFRATLQWFCNLQKDDLLEKTLKEIGKINFVPKTGQTRLSSTIASRTEWCISRQRNWGVPIPAIHNTDTAETFISSDFILKIAEGVEKEGVEYWDNLSLDEIKKMIPQSFGNAIKKEKDILDVWFDSGISHYAVLKDNKNLGFPADLYLEGSDQHRGWFQSSLLSSMVLNGKAQTKDLITHGYVVDKKGHKMSKSVGNVVAPEELIKRYSRDITRLWVASTSYENDMVLSEVVMKNAAEVYRKIRNTSRFLLSNLYDFKTSDAIELGKLPEIDKFALARLKEVSDSILDAYNRYDTPEVFHILGNYCTSDLSSFYLDIIKDRLYVEKSDCLVRRSAQTVCYQILDTLTKLMAPILSFLAEEIYQDFSVNKDSVHLTEFNQPVSMEINKEQWQLLQVIRITILKALEDKRSEGLIRHSLEAKVTLHLNDDVTTVIRDFAIKEQFFKELFIVSQVEFATSPEGLESGYLPCKVEHADGVKCPRCWQWDITDHPDELCKRCIKVLQ